MTNKPTQAEVLTRRRLSRRDREEKQKKILYTIIAVTVAMVVLVLAFGAYQEYVAKPASPIALVNGTPISTRNYQSMVQYQRFQQASQLATLQAQLAQLDPTREDEQFLVQYIQQQIQSVQSLSYSLATDALDDMIDDELIRQEATRRSITVTESELQAKLEEAFGYQRNPPTPTPAPTVPVGEATPTPAPTVQQMTKDEFDQNYSEYILALRKQIGMSEPAFRRLFESTVYREELQGSFAEQVPTIEDQVHARHILTETQEEAQKALERLRAGEDFAALVKELSIDTSSTDGDLGWFPKGQMVEEFDAAAFALQPGEISEPISTTYGFHVIQVLERDPSRPLDEYILEQRKSAALTDWLAEQRQSEGVQRFWSSDKVPPVPATMGG